MFKRLRFCLFLVMMVVSFTMFFCGCAKPPTMEMENAEKAITEAKQKEADLYVEDIFLKAEESLKRAKDLVAVKKYKEAKKAAQEAVSLTQQAISKVEANKKKMKADSVKMLNDVQVALDEFKSRATEAIKKKSPINREEIQGMVGKWELDLISVKDQLQTQLIRQAYDQLVSIQKEIKSQQEHLVTTVESKTEGKK